MALAANLMLVALSLIMGLRLLRQYLVKSRTHTLWYAVGLLLTAAAAFPEVWHKLTGTVNTPLWWLYWVAASALVGYLAVGTAYLISPTVGRITLIGVSLLTAWLVVAVVLNAGSAPGVVTETTFSKAPNTAIKLPFAIQAAVGSTLILAGALWSFIKTRGMYNVWIALGTLVFAAGGSAAGLLKFPGVFYFTQMAGIILLYLGVSLSSAPRPANKPAA